MIQGNLLGTWLELQKQVLGFYQQCCQLPQKEQEEKNNRILGEGYSSLQDLTQNWLQASNQFLNQSLKYWEGSSSQTELLKKVFNGVDLYQKLNRFWLDLSSSITDKDSDPLQFCDRWNQEYQSIIDETMVACLPEQLRNFYKDAQGVGGISAASAGKFFKPWFNEAKHLQLLLQKSSTGDQEAYLQFHRLWNDNFSDTFGKVLNIPEFSMNREQMQKQMHAVNALIKFINTMNQFGAAIYKVNQDTLYEIVTGYQEQLVSGNNPKTFKEFYKYWLKQNEAAYLKLFGTSEFSMLLAQVLDAGVNFKKGFDNLLEKQLEFLPYPSKTDMDSVYKTLNALKRDVRTLKKEVAALK